MRNPFCYNCNLWDDGVVPYEFDENVNQVKKINTIRAMRVIESLGNVHFVPRESQFTYLLIEDSDEGNSSNHIGKGLGRQKIKLLNWESQSIIIHELFHVLGFHHEQQRQDRDNYVTIIEENICSGYLHNFEYENTGVTDNIPYDFLSIMHYPKDAFGMCNNMKDCSDKYCGRLPTIIVNSNYRQYQNSIGNRRYLSFQDSFMVSAIYPYPNSIYINCKFEPTFFGPSGDGTSLQSPRIHFNELNYYKYDFDYHVYIMPGVYSDSKGIYSRRFKIEAPFGDVIIK